MTSESDPRIFLGWERALPQAVVAWLIATWPSMDYTGVQVVLPGGRAGRRVVALLADAAQAAGLAMVPPTVLTPGALPEQLHAPSELRPAGQLARRVAWAAALRGCPAEAGRLFPRLAADDGNWAAADSAARTLDQCWTELAAARRTFADLAAPSGTAGPLRETERPAAAAAVHDRYRRVLAGMGLADLQDERERAIASGAGPVSGTLVLAGVADLTPQLRAMLRPALSALRVLVYAPAHLSEGFDAFGGVRTAYWLERPVDVSAAALRVAETANDVAAAALVAIAEGGPISADRVTLCVAAESFVPPLERLADDVGVPVRYGPGTPLSGTRPYHLLVAVGEYLQARSFAAFARLILHPDVSAWLDAALGPPPMDAGGGDRQSLLDEYAARHLPAELGPDHAQAAGWCGEGVPAREGADPNANHGADPPDAVRRELARTFAAVTRLLGGAWAPAAGDGEPALSRAAAILAVLNAVYGGRDWDTTDDADRRVVHACLCLREVLAELHDTEGRPGTGPWTAADAVRAVLSLAAPARVPPRQTGDEVDVVGWLELIADDGERVVVLGFNDGLVPEAVGPHPLLTDSLRSELGLVADGDRCARDAYALTAALGSRPANAVTLVAARLSPAGDPLQPSRLLYRCDARTAADRVLWFAGQDAGTRRPQTPRLARRRPCGTASAFPAGPVIPPAHLITPPASMAVTSFRDYLRSPQGFYLRHVLRLRTLDHDDPREMASWQCGDLVHAVVRAYAADEDLRDATDADACRRGMAMLLDRAAAERFGRAPSAALRFQLALLGERVDALARWQAAWAAQGWRIRHYEWEPPGTASIEVDGVPMALRGRIDRIDHNARTGEWAVLDYKVTAGRPRTPEEAHLGAGGLWRDLQLPLYRHLAAEVVDPGRTRLGYVAVCDSLPEVGGCLAEWDAGALAGADEAARAVVRDVRAARFHEPGDDPPADGVFAHIFNTGLIGDADSSDAGTEGGDA